MDTEMIDGYDELPEDMQAKVLRALEQGHVDDEDWKGVSIFVYRSRHITRVNTTSKDPEMNVPGSSGKVKRKTKKQLQAEQEVRQVPTC